MLKQMTISNLTAFSQAKLDFTDHLNVIAGENGTGKAHLLKIATDTLLDIGCLLWDEPEANLNPRLVKWVAQSILDLCHAGIQIFIATHSLFLVLELKISLSVAKTTKPRKPVDARFSGLRNTPDGVQIEQGPTLDDIGNIASLKEELIQSDRYMAGAA